MQSYNVWQDLFDTYQSLSDWIKALWLIAPMLFVLGLVAVLRIRRWPDDEDMPGKLIYSIHRDEENQLHIISHIGLPGTPTLVLLDRPGKPATIDSP